ncbi:MAG: PLP-dependent aminotransferase family protein [bacterium]
MIDLVKNFSIIARRMKKSVIRELLKLTNKPEIISFAGGLPDTNSFPQKEILEIAKDVLSKDSRIALQYGETAGDPRLRSELVKLAKKDGENITEDNILVTVASQQGLDMLGKIFIDPSDPILVELPSYVGGLQAFTCYGAHMVGVPMDDDGLIVDVLEEHLKQLKAQEEHYKFIYVVPDFQNPSGVTLSLERRKKLIRLSHEYHVLIIEDTPYRELRFEGEKLPSLKSLDTTDNVVSLHSFSKILTPGLRVGWVVAHPSIINKLTIAKQSIDLCTPPLSQAIAYEFMHRGLLEGHIEVIKKVYKKKRDTMLAALEKHMPRVEGLRWTHPQGGLFLWLVLPEEINADDLFPEALKENVAYVTGTAFHCDGSGHNTMRLNFSYPSEEQIWEGIKRLAHVIEKKLLALHVA